MILWNKKPAKENRNWWINELPLDSSWNTPPPPPHTHLFTSSTFEWFLMLWTRAPFCLPQKWISGHTLCTSANPLGSMLCHPERKPMYSHGWVNSQKTALLFLCECSHHKPDGPYFLAHMVEMEENNVRESYYSLRDTDSYSWYFEVKMFLIPDLIWFEYSLWIYSENLDNQGKNKIIFKLC